MKFKSLKFIISVSMISTLTILATITIIYIKGKLENELYRSMENNALNLLNATENTVETQYFNILNLKKHILESRKKEIKDNVSIIYSMLDWAYKSSVSEEKAKAHVLKEIKKIRFGTNGYFWINNTDKPFPKMIMHSIFPELDNKVLNDKKFNCVIGTNKNLFKEFVDISLKNGSGYVRYLWPKPNNGKTSKALPKISFVKIFKPWNWIIGTGIYLDDIDILIDKNIKKILNNLNKVISKQKVGTNGYIFIFNNNDNLLVHPSYLGEKFIDYKKNKKLLDKFKLVALKKNNTIDYYWNKTHDLKNFTYHKRAFVIYFKPLKWYIVSSIYLDDYRESVEILDNNLFVLLIFFIMISSIFSILLSKKITESLYYLIKSINNLDETGVPNNIVINTSILEFNDIANKFNEMFSHIKESQKKRFELELQLNQSRKMDAIGQLAGGIAHDFKNILTGIINSAYLLKNSNSDFNKENLELIDLILLSSKRATKLTSKLLSFSFKGKLIYNPLNINKIIKDSIDILSKTIDKKISIVFVNEAKVCEILGDDSQLENIFINMGINSSHAMIDGGKLIFKTENVLIDEANEEVHLSNIKRGNYIKITVKDTGIGIEKDVLSKIFEPFFTTKEQGKGTGLGLTAVYRTIINHNGRIIVDSEIKRGTVFTIYIPCCQKMKKNTEDKKEVRNIVIQKKKRTVLLVDDEDFIRITEEKILKRLGYTVLIAKNGKEGLKVFKNNFRIIDFVIMDMIMPEMNGREAFYKMKKINNDIKIIISSGFTKNENLEILRKDGLFGFLEKPFSIEQLINLLNTIN